MADTKISAMTAATLPLTGTELVPIVQGGNNRKTTVADLDAYNRSYGSWSDNTDQPGSTIAGTVMTYNTADVTDGITLVSGSQITVPNTGIFDLQFSAQFVNTDNAQHEVWIWARVNGVDVPNSATIVTVPARKNNFIFGYAVAAWNLFFNLNSNDYIELVWLKSSATVTMESLPATVSPVIPAIPSVIVSVQQVS
jgi:hypothetical protein